jgi:hypothetical protein
MFDKAKLDDLRDETEKTVLSKITEAFEVGFDEVQAYEGGTINFTGFVPADDVRAIPHCEVRGFGETPDEALADWKEDLRKQPQTGRVLFWRIRPEMDWSRDFRSGKTLWKVYARFAVDGAREQLA